MPLNAKEPNGRQLNARQWRLVKAQLENEELAADKRLTKVQLAEKAGYVTKYDVNAHRAFGNPNVKQEIARFRQEYRKAAGITKKKVIDGFLEAIHIARKNNDPSPMIAGYREIAKICGLYAPTKSEIKLSGTVQQQIQHLSSLSDAELLNIIEGEYEEVEDDKDEAS